MHSVILVVCGLLSFLGTSIGQSPTEHPTPAPTFAPSEVPTSSPTAEGTPFPTPYPTRVEDFNDPTGQPTSQPTIQPTSQPSGQPTFSPTHSGDPTFAPTPRPTAVAPPTFQPTPVPTDPTMEPTPEPSVYPSGQPTGTPTTQPSNQPTSSPSRSDIPTPQPTEFAPTSNPSGQPTNQPSMMPSGQPTSSPSAGPTEAPTLTAPPTEFMPTPQPSSQPSGQPTTAPSISPNPTKIPSGQPTGQPSSQPSCQPTFQPSGQPTTQPSVPTSQPSATPTVGPTERPTLRTLPTESPTPRPSWVPTPVPSTPTMDPTTGQPATPSGQPSSEPSSMPTGQPTTAPTLPSPYPTGQPTSQPSGQPTCRPSSFGNRDEWYSAAPTPLFSRDSVTGTVNFDPAEVGVCEDMEVQIEFDPSLRMNQFGAYRINTPGVTIGNCKNVTELAGHSDGEGIKLQASWPYDVRFFEGKFSNAFLGSYIIAQYNYQGQLPVPGPTQKLYLDRSNGLKRTCPGQGQNSTWAVYRYIQSPLFDMAAPTAAPTMDSTGWVPTPNPTSFVPGLVDEGDTLYPTSSPTGLININVPAAHNGTYESGYVGLLNEQNTYLETMCFVYHSKLEFWPAWHHADVTVNLTLTLGQTLSAGDTIDLYLPGFTNRFGHYPLNPGLVFNETTHEEEHSSLETIGQWAALKNITTFDTPQVGLFQEIGPWAGYWYEGENATDYEDSYLRLYANRTFPAGVQFSIVIDRCPNALVAVFGREPNYRGFNFVVTGSAYYTNNTIPSEADAIGDGCRALNYCNNQGHCDHKTSTCTCFEGYGSWFDRLKMVSDDFLPDCSARACPVGPAVGSIPKDLSTGLHREVECSNVGTCNRASGTCVCPPGFEGDSCARRSCPRGRNGEVCSGRGRCKPMHRLASDGNALPLSGDNSITYTAAKLNGSKASWDADMGHACVCDSTWAVGLGANEIQLAEFFGPACELRRCPSADDPVTTLVDETDCYQLSQQSGGDAVGESQNICHVNCANHGSCNFREGTCTCHDGWYGTACNNRVTQVGHGTRERLTSEL